jgi:hypothetical protein
MVMRTFFSPYRMNNSVGKGMRAEDARDMKMVLVSTCCNLPMSPYSQALPGQSRFFDIVLLP